jgi:hypothetical protein
MQSPGKRASRQLAGNHPQQYLRLEQKHRKMQRLEARKGRISRHISGHATPPKKCIWNGLLHNALPHKVLAPIDRGRHGRQRIPDVGLQQVLDDLRQLEGGNLELLWRTVHQRGGGRDRRATQGRCRPEGRVSRVLHLKPEEPKILNERSAERKFSGFLGGISPAAVTTTAYGWLITGAFAFGRDINSNKGRLAMPSRASRVRVEG